MDHETYVRQVEKSEYPENPRVPLPQNFEDNRGVIQNLLLSTVRNVAIVTSKKGTTRSNHYHKEDWHYLYVISGSFNYYERPVDGLGDNKPLLVKAGELVFTAPMRVHRTDFIEDTVMISMGKNPQEHTRHEEDVVRMEY
jgi:quercetin dioxygenase-like cupin family protein|tara:strand:+ start:586298 stop:586717 length:420 start_codon:yes stop_codon:yes gene_type:complete